MPHTHRLKHHYTGSDADYGHLSRAAQELKESDYPVRFRKKGSQSKGVVCRDAYELIGEVGLHFDDYPHDIIELTIKFKEEAELAKKPRHR